MATSFAIARPTATAAPRWALVEVEGGFLVEAFNASQHLTSHGWSKGGVSLFCDREEVAHLRDQILN